jgi:uncharacterized protein involved in exopolysaccharide biosynthesis
MKKQSLIRDCLDSVVEHRWSICLVLIVSLTLSYLAAPLLPKRYKSSTMVIISPATQNLELSELDDASRSSQALMPGDREMAANVGILNSEVVAGRIAGMFPQRSAESIKNNIDVHVFAHTNQVKISVKDRDPSIAAEIANAYPIEANKLYYEVYLQPLLPDSRQLEEKLQQNQKKFDEVKAQLQQLKDKYKVNSPSEEIERLFKKRESYIAQLDEDRIRLKEIDSKIDYLKKQLSQERKMRVSSLSLTTNPLIGQLRSTLSSLQIDLEGARSMYADQHPKIVKLRREYEQTKKNLAKEVGKIFDSQTKSINPLHEKLREMLVTNLVVQSSLNARIGGLENMLQTVDQKSALLSKLEQDFIRLNNEAAVYQSNLNSTIRALQQARFTETGASMPFKIVQKAVKPQQPYFPSQFVTILFAGLLSLVIAISYVICLVYSGKRPIRQAPGIKLLEWQLPGAHSIATECVSKGLLTPQQVYDVLTIQIKQAGWQFIGIAINRGYLTDRQVKQIVNTN